MSEPRKIDQVEEYSEQLRETLLQVPRFFLRWGTLFVTAILVGLLSLLWIVEYPDVVMAQITVTTETPPATVVARTSGALTDLRVQDNDPVQEGQILGIIENTARLADLRAVQGFLSVYSRTADSLPREPLVLGEAQSAYAQFIDALKQYRLQIALDPQLREREAVLGQLEENRQLLTRQQAQLTLNEEELALGERDLARHRRLLDENAISPAAFETKERDFLALKRAVETTRVAISNTRITIAELQKTRDQLEIQNSQTINQLRQQVQQTEEALKQAIRDWEQRYLLRAPMDGQVTFFDYWSANQYLNVNEEVFTVVPDAGRSPIGKLMVPIQNSGKVEEGQRVVIKLTNYPYREFGALQGTVERISLVPKNGFYSMEVSLNNGLTTTHHQELTFRQEMQGTAEIVTEDLRLIERIFYQLREILNQG